MKHAILIGFLCLIISGCSSAQNLQGTATPEINSTEIPCPGVEPKGLSIGKQAYYSISGKIWATPIYQKASTDSKQIGELFHHIRVDLVEGPVCGQGTAWWRLTTPDGLSGWAQIGQKLIKDGRDFSTAFLPFTGDAVQQDVPEGRRLEAQVRYILADIELGNEDVLKYYQDQLAAKPDDPESKPIGIALQIIKEAGKGNVLANAVAFERKPLRGGTSVVDAGTEFVQPGLDIRVKPCDVPEPVPVFCKLFIQ
jgi:hypothetical protein